MERITSRQNPLMAHIRKLASSRAYRNEAGEYLGDGVKLLEEAARWGASLTTVVFTAGTALPPLPTEVRLVEVPEGLMASISPMEAPQGVLFLARQPELRTEKLERYKREFDIPRYDAEIITESKRMADVFEETAALCGKPKKAANWLMVETMRLMKEHDMEPEDLTFSPANLAKLIELADAGTVNSSVAKKVFEKIFTDDVEPEAYVKEQGLGMVNDEDALRGVIEKVLADNPKAVEDYRGGKEKAMGALVGQTMRAMKGKADPGMVNAMLKKMLQD